MAASALSATKAETRECNGFETVGCPSVGQLDKMSILQHIVHVQHDGIQNVTAHLEEKQNHTIARKHTHTHVHTDRPMDFKRDFPVLAYASALVFLGLAWWSICDEACCMLKDDKETMNRDVFWDIAKFALMVCVLSSHAETNAIPYDLYSDFFMPAFFIVAGLFQQGKGFIDNTVLVRVLRDNVLNNLLLQYLAIIILGESQELRTLWFLWAMAFYRLLLAPCFHIMTCCLGHLLGCFVSVVGVGFFLMGLGLGGLGYEDRFINLCSQMLLCNTWDVRQIFLNATFYLLGLAVERSFLRKVLGSPCTTIVALSFLVAKSRIWILTGIIYEWPEIAELNAGDAALLAIWRTFGSLAFIACAAPIVDLPFLRPLSYFMGACGRRTLYGYVLHVNMRSLPLGFFTWELTTSGGNFVFVFSLMAALCSPLAEHCFAWLVSPQWVLDVAASMHQRISSAASSWDNALGK